MHLLATTNGGLESITAAETATLVGVDADVHHRGVIEFDGNYDNVYDLHYQSRTCHRLLEVLVDAPISELSDVYDRVREAAIAEHLPFESFGVVGTRHGTHEFTSMDVAERVGQAVIDEYREETSKRLPVDLDDPTVRLEAYLYDDRFTLAVDLTGDSLHKRPYRVCEHDAPLRATLAYSMLHIAEYEADDRLVDPMAGSATIPIEAALSAADRVPRPDLDPAFEVLPNYDAEAFYDRRAAHSTGDPALDIEAREKRQKWRKCARVNREAADLEGKVDIAEADAREAAIDADCVVTNLPFGIRVSDDLRGLYQAFADRVREGDVDRLVALTTKPDLLPLDAVDRYDIPYGRIDAAIVVCEP
ncbi:MAG: tRNA (guanine6-N2)-methyltransferase [Natronomonas sp.]|uniref:THUMP domain-containing class I SAM-dependent RNA methyltransferase n=1 Tax=Natronomonas sp. TaxID=2184060 RepID=UPI0039890D4D